MGMLPVPRGVGVSIGYCYIRPRKFRRVFRLRVPLWATHRGTRPGRLQGAGLAAEGSRFEAQGREVLLSMLGGAPARRTLSLELAAPNGALAVSHQLKSFRRAES